MLRQVFRSKLNASGVLPSFAEHCATASGSQETAIWRNCQSKNRIQSSANLPHLLPVIQIPNPDDPFNALMSTGSRGKQISSGPLLSSLRQCARRVSWQ